MTPSIASSTNLVPSTCGVMAVPVTEHARQALERLLDLGVQVVDGNLAALLEIPATLAEAVDGLRGVHGVFEALPVSCRQPLVPILAVHAARRKRLDLDELNTLVKVVAAAERPEAVGRRVVIAALVLLSNLESDERWFGALHARRPAA